MISSELTNYIVTEKVENLQPQNHPLANKTGRYDKDFSLLKKTKEKKRKGKRFMESITKEYKIIVN